MDRGLQSLISFAGPPAQFFPLLIPTVWQYGTLADGRNALVAVLTAAKEYVGQEGKTKCDELIENIQKFSSEETAQQADEPVHQQTHAPMKTKKTILILSANPKDTARLRLDEEVREIDEGLRRSKYRDQFEIKSKWAIRLRDLRRALLDENPEIVHFCGHANTEGLHVEDETGKAVLASPEALAGLFKQFSTIECLLLNACYSESQAQAIRQHIPYVIGMSSAICDKAALEFAIGFYDGLGAGRSIEDAFEFGCNAIELSHIPSNFVVTLVAYK